ncbi:MAG TPA: bifunctional diaminohydroxyphosphoribosylaminopyrimidine deaminase/5-amino-6-(5-phosphoribosylamino)uracil reductase RibD [Bacillaceae bacterium]
MAGKDYYMDLALKLAASVLGQTSPNPAVGCVVVKEGEIVGMGAHLKAGEGHAEVHALEQAGEKAAGADLYVTLEPCSHYGRTPPCADMIIARKVKRVYIASLDPNPLVSGRGAEKLRRAGILVETGIHEEEAENLNKYFFHYMRTKWPYVTLKAAVTLDGKTAASTGDSKWITSEEARVDVHLYRHRHDAILAGIQTVIHDNPQLTTRLPQGGRNPLRIVLDTDLRIPLESRLLTDKAAPSWIVCGRFAESEKQEQLEHLGARVKRMDTERIDIRSLLEWLGKEQIMSVFVEGGSRIHGSFIDEGLFQELVMYVAPKTLADHSGFSAFAGMPKSKMEESKKLQFTTVEQVGPDIKIVAVPIKEGGITCLRES